MDQSRSAARLVDLLPTLNPHTVGSKDVLTFRTCVTFLREKKYPGDRYMDRVQRIAKHHASEYIRDLAADVIGALHENRDRS